jgi:uncharacterized protein RhaS with RHS repeats
MRNRWYDPQTGRFLSQDPIGLAGGVNLYAYAGNNPASYSDPFGLMICCPQDKKGDANKRAIAQAMFADGIPQPTEAGPGPADPGYMAGTIVDPSAVLGPAEAKLGAALLIGLARTAEATAWKSIGSLGTKALARDAVNRMGLSDAQHAAVRSAIGRATAKEEIEVMSNGGGSVMVNLIRPGSDGFQVMQSVVKADATKVVTQYGVSEAGRIHIDPKSW